MTLKKSLNSQKRLKKNYLAKMKFESVFLLKMKMRNIYSKINKYASKHTLMVNILFLIIGLIIGILITYNYGIQIGHSKIYNNGSGICIGQC